MMEEESEDQIMARVIKLNSLTGSLCTILMNASLRMDDEESAEYLFKRLRVYATSTEQADEVYGVDLFLGRIEELVELSKMFRGVPVLTKIHNQIRDSYEVLLFNRAGLYKVLNELKRQDTMEGLRDNYWMN